MAEIIRALPGSSISAGDITLEAADSDSGSSKIPEVLNGVASGLEKLKVVRSTVP